MKWAFQEDFIVCNFYLTHVNTWKECINEVMTELASAGFGSREQGSVIMRIQNFRNLHTGKGLSNVAIQSKNVYNVFAQRIQNPTINLNINIFIENNYVPFNASNSNSSSPFDITRKPQNLSTYVPIGNVGPSFQEVLFKFIDSRGMKDSDVYNSCFVGRDTFSHIRKGDRGVSKKTIKQLCFGLKLSYDDAVILMESAGFAFSNNSIADLVVAYFLKNEIYDIFAANAELYDRNEELLFSA